MTVVTVRRKIGVEGVAEVRRQGWAKARVDLNGIYVCSKCDWWGVEDNRGHYPTDGSSYKHFPVDLHKLQPLNDLTYGVH